MLTGAVALKSLRRGEPRKTRRATELRDSEHIPLKKNEMTKKNTKNILKITKTLAQSDHPTICDLKLVGLERRVIRTKLDIK